MIYVRQTYGPKDFSKTGEGYEKIMSIIECTLSFLILRSCSMCLCHWMSLQKPELVDEFAISYYRSKCLWVDQFQSWRKFFVASLFLSDLFVNMH